MRALGLFSESVSGLTVSPVLHCPKSSWNLEEYDISKNLSWSSSVVTVTLLLHYCLEDILAACDSVTAVRHLVIA